MKLTTCLLIIGSLHISAASLSQTVTLSVKDRSFAEVLLAIQEQTGFFALSSMEVLAKAKPVSIQLKNTPIEESLRELFNGQPLTYEISGKNILVREIRVKASPQAARHPEAGERDARVPNEHLILAIPTVTGRITDTLGQPLSGASVVVLSPEGKRTSLQTTTKANGIFVLENVPEGAMLRISFMGYVEQEIPAKAQLGTIRLKPSESPLDEVQVMAYGTTSRRLSTGNIGTVRAKDIENQPGVTNPLLALQGRIPGLILTQQTGVPGGGVVVRIQGQNSMRSGNAPLYVVDGVPIVSFLPGMNGQGMLGNSGVEQNNVDSSNEGNPLSYLNPTDIESIDVLKDADATAIYGSRAANGAILITTKKGRIGKMQMEANVNLGVAQAAFDNAFQMLNTRQYLDMRYEAYKNDGIDWHDPSVNAPDLKLWDTTRYTDWRKEFMGGTALTQQMRLALSGGTAGGQYRLAGTYSKTGSVFPDNGNGNPIASISANLGSTSTNQRLRMNWSTNYQHNHSEVPAGNFMEVAWRLPPHAPNPFNDDGTLNWAPDANGNSTFTNNPYIGAAFPHESTTRNLISNLNLGYKVFKSLELSTSLGYTHMQTETFRPIPNTAIRPEYRETTRNSAQYAYRNMGSWIAEPQLNYKKRLEVGDFDILVGGTWNEQRSNLWAINGENYPSDALLDNMGFAGYLNSGATATEYNYQAFFSRLNYNLGDQYIVNLNARRDGSSRFGNNRRFSTFWSAGGAWVFTQQPILQKSLPWLSFGKLRLSYGVTGSDQIGDFQFIRTFSTYNLQVPYQGIGALQATGLPNPDLEWERVSKLSAGLDFGFVKDRFLLNITYASNTSGNQLGSYNLSQVTGSSSMTRNLPATIRNTTWEFSLTSTNVKSKDFNWTTMTNVSLARNKLVDYPDLERSPYANQYVIGEPIDIRRLVRFGGLNDATGNYQFLDANGQPITGGFVTPDDYIFRSFLPSFYGGLQNNLRWKSFSISTHIQFTKQWGPNLEYYVGGLLVPGNFITGVGGNLPTTVLDRWQQPGDRAKIAKYTTISGSSGTDYFISASDIWFREASFARLKNVAFSWQLPGILGKRLGIQSASLTVSGQNLLTLTNFHGPDPETATLTALPPLRVFSLGVQVVL